MTTCKECGADFDEQLPACPFCGALNYAGAEEQYLEHLEEINNDLSHMADSSKQAYRGSLKKSTLIIITTLCCCLMLAAALFAVAGIIFQIRSAASEPESGEAQKAQILWRNEYTDRLDELYAAGDYDGIVTFLNEHAGDEGFSPYGWEHLDFIEIYDSYAKFKTEAEQLDKNDLNELTWCLYDAASVDYAAAQDLFVYTEEETALIASWLEETDAFYRETLGLTESEIVQMKSEIASDDDLAIPTSENCRKFLKKRFDF